jgi:hypothetical protein
MPAIEVKRFENPDQLLDMKDKGRISVVQHRRRNPSRRRASTRGARRS